MIAAMQTDSDAQRHALISLRTAIGKIVLTLAGLCCGASVGREGPSIQVGASLLWALRGASHKDYRALILAGSAAGLAAAFNAPIAGVFFALEIVLGEISGSALGVVLLASVVSSVFTQAVSGPQPAFSIPISPYFSSLELPFYLGLGLLAGPWSALYVRLIYWAQDLFGRWTAPRSRRSCRRSQRSTSWQCWRRTAAAWWSAGLALRRRPPSCR